MEDLGLKFRQEEKSHLQTSRPALGPIQPPTKWTLVSYPLRKRKGRAFVHSPLSGAEVKKEWTYISTPSICFRGVDRENFTLFPLHG
jgi:hypothetical protein